MLTKKKQQNGIKLHKTKNKTKINKLHKTLKCNFKMEVNDNFKGIMKVIYMIEL